MRKISIIAFLIISINSIIAQPVKITGEAKGCEGKKIILKTYADYISESEKNIGSTLIDSAGKFSFSCFVPETSLVFLQIEYYTGEMYVEPNKTYDIELRNIVFNDQNDQTNYNLMPFTAVVKVKSEDNNGLNTKIQKLNIQYNRFLNTNAKLLNSGKIHSKIDSLVIKLQSDFGNGNSTYFSDYLNYRIASLLLMTSRVGMRQLLSDLIVSKAIAYHNVEYMTFFNAYFENYFSNITSPVKLNDFFQAVNQDRSLTSAVNVMGKDTLIKNEILREFVLLKALDLMYNSSNFSKNAVVEILEQIAAKSKSDTHRFIVQSMIAQYARYRKGNPAPEFTLINTNDSLVHSRDFIGKPVVYAFFTTWSTISLNELDVMKKLYEKYAPMVEFVGICCDREPMKAFYFKQERKYSWQIVHFNQDYDLLQNFNVLSYPTFVVMDAKGKFVACPAGFPSETLEATISGELKNQKSKP
jgi:thiol-disulfide isomerase/thioredoxin